MFESFEHFEKLQKKKNLLLKHEQWLIKSLLIVYCLVNLHSFPLTNYLMKMN